MGSLSAAVDVKIGTHSFSGAKHSRQQIRLALFNSSSAMIVSSSFHMHIESTEILSIPYNNQSVPWTLNYSPNTDLNKCI